MHSIAVGPNGTFLTAGNDKSLRLWNAELAGQQDCLSGVFHGHASFVQSCDVEPHTQMMASVSLDTTLRLWHPTTPNSVFCATLPVAAGCVRFVEGECSLLITSGPSKPHLGVICKF
jgi:WD40 repeat protein